MNAIGLAASGPPREDLTVRVYAREHLEHVSRGAALAVAADILRGAGVAVAWLECDSARRDPACESAIGDDLVIRFVSEPLQHAPRAKLPLGEALVDEGERGTFATVYASRVRWLARMARTDPAVLLGRVVAHELGHLLIGRKAHSDKGLMRANWSHRDVRSARPGDWAFSAEDVAAMSRGGVVMEGGHHSVAGG